MNEANFNRIQQVVKNIQYHAGQHKAGRVSRIVLKVGKLLGISDKLFRKTFSDLTRNTLLQDAEIELVFFPGTRIEVFAFEVD